MSSSRPQPLRFTTAFRKSISLIVLLGEADVGGGIFQQHPAPENRLHSVQMIADADHRFLGIGQRQQIVQVGVGVARPGEVFAHQPRLVALDKSFEAREMRFVQGARTADGKADAVQRERIVAADKGVR